MNNFDKVYKNYDPSTKKLAIFEILIDEIEDTMNIYQDGW